MTTWFSPPQRLDSGERLLYMYIREVPSPRKHGPAITYVKLVAGQRNANTGKVETRILHSYRRCTWTLAHVRYFWHLLLRLAICVSSRCQTAA